MSTKGAAGPGPDHPTPEQVLVVERAAHFGGTWPQGFVALPPAERQPTLERLERTAVFMDRPRAEEDPSHKQLIPYCALLAGPEVFCVERLPAQGEARLHGKLSIGIGGHINPVDTGTAPISSGGRSPAPGTVRTALQRELCEELTIPATWPDRARFVGLINDDSDPVGSVHVGLVFLLQVPAGGEELVQVREISHMRGGFRRLVGSPTFWQDQPRLESWSGWLVGGLSALTGTSSEQEFER